MSEIINESMSSREMLDILVAKNMEDAREAKKRRRTGMLVQLYCSLRIL